MADINIQRKKSAPSPWLLVLLAAAALAVGAYFFLRPDAADEPTPPAPAAAPASAPDTVTKAAAPAPADTNAPRTARRAHPETLAEAADGPSETVASLAAQVATPPTAPDYAQQGLAQLTAVLVSLADRDDLRDPTVAEQRDNLTSATNRLGETGTSLRPGFVAAANFIRAVQQKAYPDQEAAVAALVQQAGQLSGRHGTPAEQRQNQQFLTQAAAVVRALNEPAR